MEMCCNIKQAPIIEHTRAASVDTYIEYSALAMDYEMKKVDSIDSPLIDD